jgi:hypothetical protein
MNNSTSARLGRRVDHILLDQSAMAWTHRVLGFVAGCTLTFAMIATGHMKVHLSWVAQRAFSARAALVFFVGALPLVVSYFENRNRVDDNVPRTIGFLWTVALVSVVADVIVVLSIAEGLWKIGALYAAQAVLYVALGALMLPKDPRDKVA